MAVFKSLKYLFFSSENPAKKMSAEQIFSVATIGYIRKLEDQYRLNLPNEIKNIIVNYSHMLKINYTGKFLAQHGGNLIQIAPDQLSFTGTRYITMDQPLPTSTKGEQGNDIPVIYRWRAIAEGLVDRQPLFFGVLSNRCNTHMLLNYSHMFLSDAYGICMQNGLLFDGSWFESRSYGEYKAFKPNEIICMEYEIYKKDKCVLSFYIESKNHELLWKVDLPKSIGWININSWYPVFSKPNSWGSITVIPY